MRKNVLLARPNLFIHHSPPLRTGIITLIITSTSFETSLSRSGRGMCWGQILAHLPHCLHNPADESLESNPPWRVIYQNLELQSWGNRCHALYREKQPGISTPAGQGIQYRQSVLSTFISFRQAPRTCAMIASSAGVREHGSASCAKIFICMKLLIHAGEHNSDFGMVQRPIAEPIRQEIV